MNQHVAPKTSLLNYERVKSDAASALAYTNRRPEKHRFEMQMVSEAMHLLPEGEVRHVLDAPCGVGRLSLWLGQQGYQVTAIDLGDAAVQFTRSLLAEHDIAAEVRCQNLFALQYPYRHFDATVCFRLLHHFASPADQQALIVELCRVSAKYVVISYFSTWSYTTMRRRLRQRIFGTPIKQYPNTLAELEAMFRVNNFKLRGCVRRSKFLHSLQVAVFERQS